MKHVGKENVAVLASGLGITIGTPMLVLSVVAPDAGFLMVPALVMLLPSMIAGMR